MKKLIRKRLLVLSFIIVFVALMTLTVAPALAAPTNTDDITDPTDLADMAIPAGFGIVGISAFGLAEVIKRATSIKRERLPLILAVFGIFMGIVIVIFNPAERIPIDATWQDIGWYVIQGAIYGCMSGLAAVGLHQMIKQGEQLKYMGSDSD